MKTKLLLFTFLLFGMISCKEDQKCNTNIELCGQWNLINISGGFAGVNDDFEKGTITWTFDESTKELNVVNDNTENVIYDGFDTGNYPYEIIELNNKKYIKVNNEELGEAKPLQSSLTIDQNSSTQGNGADGFIFSFER